MKCFILISNEGLRAAGRSFALEEEVVVSKIQEDSRDPYSIISNPALLTERTAVTNQKVKIVKHPF